MQHMAATDRDFRLGKERNAFVSPSGPAIKSCEQAPFGSWVRVDQSTSRGSLPKWVDHPLSASSFEVFRAGWLLCRRDLCLAARHGPLHHFQVIFALDVPQVRSHYPVSSPAPSLF